MGPTCSPDTAHMGPRWDPHVAHMGPKWAAHMGPIWIPVAKPKWGPYGQPIWGPHGNPYGAHMGPIYFCVLGCIVSKDEPLKAYLMSFCEWKVYVKLRIQLQSHVFDYIIFFKCWQFEYTWPNAVTKEKPFNTHKWHNKNSILKHNICITHTYNLQIQCRYR